MSTTHITDPRAKLLLAEQDTKLALQQARADHAQAALVAVSDPKKAADVEALEQEIAEHEKALVRINAAREALVQRDKLQHRVDQSKALAQLKKTVRDALADRNRAAEKIERTVAVLGDLLVERHAAAEVARDAILRAAPLAGVSIEGALPTASLAAGDHGAISEALYRQVVRLRDLGCALGIDFPGLNTGRPALSATARAEAEAVERMLGAWEAAS